MLQPAGGLRKVSRGGEPEGRAILESPLRKGTRRWRPSITRGGCVAAPHLNLLPLGEEARPPGPAHASACGRVAQGLQKGSGLRWLPLRGRFRYCPTPAVRQSSTKGRADGEGWIPAFAGMTGAGERRGGHPRGAPLREAGFPVSQEGRGGEVCRARSRWRRRRRRGRRRRRRRAGAATTEAGAVEAAKEPGLAPHGGAEAGFSGDVRADGGQDCRTGRSGGLALDVVALAA